MAPLSRLRAAALLVVVVVVTGVLGYRYLEGYTWFDALYMTAITLSTVGFFVVAITRASEKMVFNPAPEEKIAAGDRLVVLAEASRLKEVEELVGRKA